MGKAIDLGLHGAGELAKLTRPKAARLLERPRLFAVLDEARQGAATWISAPAGFGKTSLVSSYAANLGLECLWYRIDEEDTDVGTFFHYMYQAGERFARRDSNLDLPLFTSDNLPSLAAFARRFFERLYLRLRSPALLIFDDYQAAAIDSLLHRVLAKAVEDLPEHLHIIFLSREHPPAAFARLRTHGAFTQLDANDLRFTTEEAQALATGRGDADATVIPGMNELAGGWVAGLTLLLERGNLPLPTRLPDTATLQVLFDYFSQELFCSLESEVQKLLLQCAPFPEMPIDAVHQLMDETATHLLEELSRKNYFTTRHDGAGVVYRFHPLFRAFLLDQAAKTLGVEVLSELQKKTACVLEQCGHTEDAVALLHACEDWQALAQVILTHADSLARQGRLQMLAAWIQRLPEAVVEQTPWLLYWLGSCQLPFNPGEARATLMRAYPLLEVKDDVPGIYLCWAAVATSLNFSWSPREPSLAWVSEFEHLQTKYPDFPSPVIEAKVVLGLIGLLRLYGLDHYRFPYWLARARTTLHYLDDPNTRLLGAQEVAWTYSWVGKGAEGLALMREMSPLLTSETAPLARLGGFHILAVYAWHEADAASCADVVRRALRYADEHELHMFDAYIVIVCIYCHLTVGDTTAAKELFPRMESAVIPSRRFDASACLHAQSLLHLHSRDWEQAVLQTRQALVAPEEFGVTYPLFLNRIVLASALLELGEFREAAELFETASQLTKGVEGGFMNHVVLLGKALLEFKRGQRAQALELLREAINIAKSSSWRYTPFFYRESLSELYALGVEADLEVSYLQEQIRRQRLILHSPASAPDNWPWPIRIYTLGRFAIAKDGAPLKIGSKASRKPLQLLKTLIAFGGRDVHQDKLIAALWPDAEGDVARHTFETTLYRLRKLLGSEVLIVKDAQLTLDSNYCWVDSWTFERLLSDMSEGIAAGDSTAVVRTADRVLNLYQGPFLDRDHDISVAVSHRERQRSRLLRVLENLGNYWSQNGEPEKTCDCYLRALEVDPSVEIFYQRLMQQYYLLGRYPEAIAVFQRCRQTMHSLVGVTPSAEIHALHTAILAVADMDRAGAG